MVFAEQSVFELFVDFTDDIWWFMSNHPAISISIYGLLVLSNWLLFVYHRASLQEHEYVWENIHVTGRFSKPTYDMWRWAAVAIIPIGASVIVFSIITKLNTTSFLAAFGIKGSGTIKHILVYGTIKDKPKSIKLLMLIFDSDIKLLQHSKPKQ